MSLPESPVSPPDAPLSPGEPLLLRPHHFLCLAAFRGEGYSDSFIRHMAALQERYLANEPACVTFGPDWICARCPQRKGKTCAATEGIASRDLDRRIAARLALDTQPLWTWQDVAARLRTLSRPERDALCAGCSWFEKSDCGACLHARLSPVIP